MIGSGPRTSPRRRSPRPSGTGSASARWTVPAPGYAGSRSTPRRTCAVAAAGEVVALQRLASVPAAAEVPVAADPELWRLVRRLPEQQRWAVALHYVEDRPVAEVAGVLGCSEGSVKTHLSRARATLARQLDDTRKGATS